MLNICAPALENYLLHMRHWANIYIKEYIQNVNRVKDIFRSEKVKVIIIRGHRKVKYEIDQGLVMINLYGKSTRAFQSRLTVSGKSGRQMDAPQ